MKKLNSFLLAAMLFASAVSCSDSKISADETDENGNITLTLAVNRFCSPEIENIILDFNNEDNGYIVEYRNVDVTGNEMTNNQQAAYADVDINQSIMKGEIDLIMPDIFVSDRSYDSLMKQGAFADLYPFIQNDSDINSSVLDMHVLSLNEYDGKLCDMPLSYSFDTLMGAEKYVGTKENQTLDEFIANWKKMPKNSTLCYNNSRCTVFCTLNGFSTRFLDESVGKVEFDSPEFLKLLKFCETFPADTGEEYEYEYEYDLPNMVSGYVIDGFFPFLITSNYNEGKQCFIGYPSDDGNGGYINFSYYKIAMCSNISEAKQKGAWELMKRLLSKENQEYFCISQKIDISPSEHGFPINKNAFSAIGEKCINGEYHLIPTENSEGTTTLTKEEYDRLVEYIASINSVNRNISDSVYEVMSTELDAFFKGRQSAEQTANILQNRLETMVDERNG